MSSASYGYPVRSQLVSEYLGSFFLVLAAISPIILFDQVLDSGIALAVLVDALAVGFVLFALIEMFGPVSGAHFNPAVTLALWINGEMKAERASMYVLAQILGGLTGMLFSHLMFLDKVSKVAEISGVTRDEGNYIAEVLGTFLLVLCIFILIRNQSDKIPLAIGMLVGGMLIATSSTMFANPQVTLTRMFTDSAAGIRPLDGLIFIIMEVLGAILAVLLYRLITNGATAIKSLEST
jgi:glycerol uptake facilitator-like aquaporin